MIPLRHALAVSLVTALFGLVGDDPMQGGEPEQRVSAPVSLTFEASCAGACTTNKDFRLKGGN